MEFLWFKIFNLNDFIASGLFSRTYSLELEGVGLRDVLVTNGKTIGLTYEDVFLSLNLNAKNPFVFEGMATYVAESQNVYLGFLINET